MNKTCRRTHRKQKKTRGGGRRRRPGKTATWAMKHFTFLVHLFRLFGYEVDNIDEMKDKKEIDPQERDALFDELEKQLIQIVNDRKFKQNRESTLWRKLIRR